MPTLNACTHSHSNAADESTATAKPSRLNTTEMPPPPPSNDTTTPPAAADGVVDSTNPATLEQHLAHMHMTNAAGDTASSADQTASADPVPGQMAPVSRSSSVCSIVVSTPSTTPLSEAALGTRQTVKPSPASPSPSSSSIIPLCVSNHNPVVVVSVGVSSVSVPPCEVSAINQPSVVPPYTNNRQPLRHQHHYTKPTTSSAARSATHHRAQFGAYNHDKYPTTITSTTAKQSQHPKSTSPPTPSTPILCAKKPPAVIRPKRNLAKTQSLDIVDEDLNEAQHAAAAAASTSSSSSSLHLVGGKPIYPNVPYSPYGSPYGSPRGRKRQPFRESRRISIEHNETFLQLNQYKLYDKIGQVSAGGFCCCLGCS